MTDGIFAAVLLVSWVSLGLAAVLIFLTRHGRHSWWWFAIGVVLGPILLPIAAELDRRGGQLAGWTSSPRPAPGVASTGVAGSASDVPAVTVLAGVDGSVESDLALRDIARIAGPGSHVHLLTVLDPDTAGEDALKGAEERLRDRTGWLDEQPGVVVRCEVATGDPVQVLLEYAALHEVDLVVVGRRGRGLSRRVIGSVADQVVRHSPRPVLVGTVVAPQHRAD